MLARPSRMLNGRAVVAARNEEDAKLFSLRPICAAAAPDRKNNRATTKSLRYAAIARKRH